QYEGVRKGFHRRLLCWLMPRPDLTARIIVDPAVAAARNPYDIFRHEHVSEHAAIADRLAPMVPGETLVVDGQAPLAAAKDLLLRRVLNGAGGHREPAATGPAGADVDLDAIGAQVHGRVVARIPTRGGLTVRVTRDDGDLAV